MPPFSLQVTRIVIERKTRGDEWKGVTNELMRPVIQVVAVVIVNNPGIPCFCWDIVEEDGCCLEVGRGGRGRRGI